MLNLLNVINIFWPPITPEDKDTSRYVLLFSTTANEKVKWTTETEFLQFDQKRRGGRRNAPSNTFLADVDNRDSIYYVKKGKNSPY